VHDELADGRLVHVLPEYVAASETVLWLVYPKTNVLSPKVRVFMDFLINTFQRRATWLRALKVR
ncbi:MAG: LysR substrate-binding domain-containing protein, partial [Pseudomonadota bacterium]